ncbi:MAG: tRNA (N6-isopentenyl adenosine(37)-C2)-methylthiotransferase MiaB [Ruminococcaceae bacterium]|nr:tRNA (N6-isopentenyl adenosine(37)-C2)-methylthiotransferase MiaB [Oscillospiraceae bacterium]
MTKKTGEIPESEILRQSDICAQIAEINAALPKMPLAMIDTYGCQQNEADSEILRGYAGMMGFGFTDKPEDADLIIVNTCAIREHAEMRVLGNVGALRHIKAKNPNLKVAVCGCMVQQEHMANKLKRSFRVVDIAFGPHELWRFPELYKKSIESGERIFENSPSDGAIAEGMPVIRQDNIRAWISIMYGCNNFCTYCVVPHVRGRERSRKSADILAEAKKLIQEGYREITLLGQNVNSYGRDLDENIDFSGLIRMINEIPGEFLIRFMTSHPRDAGDKLFLAMAECEKCAKHLHLPVQSGSSRILKEMNRHYDRNQYLDLIKKARALMPDIVLTTDIIVGFPGETEEDFSETLSLVAEVRYDAMFTFIFSPRVGTKAYDMTDDTPKEVKKERFERLLTAVNGISAEKHAAYIGTEQKVLIDGIDKQDDTVLTARTEGGRLVRLKGGQESLIGSFAYAKITGSNTWALSGELM